MSTDTKTLSERLRIDAYMATRIAATYRQIGRDCAEAADALDAKDERGCTCLEVYGENPACPLHGRGTDWAKANPDIADLAEKAGQSDAKDALLREAVDEAASLESDFEQIRSILVNRLGEPENRAFWAAVRGRNRARTLLSKLTEATKP